MERKKLNIWKKRLNYLKLEKFFRRYPIYIQRVIMFETWQSERKEGLRGYKKDDFIFRGKFFRGILRNFSQLANLSLFMCFVFNIYFLILS